MRRKLVSEAKPNALPQAERTKSHAGLPLLRRIAHTSDRFVMQSKGRLCILLFVLKTRRSLVYEKVGEFRVLEKSKLNHIDIDTNEVFIFNAKKQVLQIE